MQSRQPQKRFNEFIQQFDQSGQAVGFRISNNDFLFQYDDFGGWKDQKGKYYNKDGILQQSFHQSQKSQDQDESVSDEQIVDQFQQMLIQQQQGFIRKKKSIKQKKQSSFAQPLNKQDYEQSAKPYIQKLLKQQAVRQGLSTQLFIYFKMKSSSYQRVQPQSQKKQDVASRNLYIQNQIRKKLQQQKLKLIEDNKSWLNNGNYLLQLSGISFEDGLYDRYWYGWVKVTHDKYFDTIKKLKNSKAFAILKSKTFYALISKFYLKKKMEETIKDLKKQITTDKEIVKITFNNLPEEFPLSLIFDFVEYCDGNIQDIIDVNILDNFAAEIICKQNTAQKIMNIQGYCYDEKQYIWLQITQLKQNQIPKILPEFNKGFNIQIDSDYKIPYAQLFDTMGLLNVYSSVQKLCLKDQHFRLIVNQDVLKRILMFRGESVNIVRVLRYGFQKKQQKK